MIKVLFFAQVRELVGKGDFAGLAGYVPPTTRAYLESDEAAAIRERLQKDFKSQSLSGC